MLTLYINLVGSLSISLSFTPFKPKESGLDDQKVTSADCTREMSVCLPPTTFLVPPFSGFYFLSLSRKGCPITL